MNGIGRPELSTLVAAGLLFIIVGAFWIRYRATHSNVSAVLAIMATGWFWLMAVMNGDVPREAFDALRFFSLSMSVLLTFGALRSSEWKRWRAQRENRRLSPREQERRKAERRKGDRRKATQEEQG